MLVGRLAGRPLDLLVALVADQDDRVALLGELARLDVDLGDQRAGGVDRPQAAAARRCRGPPGRRRGRRRRPARPRAPRSPPRRRSRRARRAARRRACCGRSPCARRRAARAGRAPARPSARRGRRRRSSRAARRAGPGSGRWFWLPRPRDKGSRVGVVAWPQIGLREASRRAVRRALDAPHATGSSGGGRPRVDQRRGLSKITAARARARGGPRRQLIEATLSRIPAGSTARMLVTAESRAARSSGRPARTASCRRRTVEERVLGPVARRPGCRVRAPTGRRSQCRERDDDREHRRPAASTLAISASAGAVSNQ